MLSRHAEDLYWTGRYIERAEDTARLLDVTYHGLLESPSEEPSTWRDLLEVLFLVDGYDGELSAEGITDFLVLDPANPGSITSAVSRARENARGVRDRISTELWETINNFHLELRARDLPGELSRQPFRVYRWVKDTCQLVSGVASETMPRDDGFRFLAMGKLLERAEMTCRLLSVRYRHLDRTTMPVEFHWWVALLKSVSAFEAYLKAHRAAVDPNLVLEFLLLAPDFPRSVLYCLRAVETELEWLTANEGIVPASRLLGRVRARVEFCDIDEIVAEGLEDFLDRLQEDIWKVGDAIDLHFFRHGAILDLHAYELS